LQLRIIKHHNPVMKKIVFIIALALYFTTPLLAQNNRISNHNTIGWYGFFGNIKTGKKSTLHTEFQWRRTNLVTNWQQALIRVGYSHQFNKRVQVRVGYALAETFAYGDIPLNGLGKNFTEHRLFEMLQLQQPEGIVEFTHRFMLEQRFVGRYSNASLSKEDEYPLLHRFRYMLRAQLPLKGREVKNGTPYLAAYNEFFIGFGKNVSANVFDQNRTGVLLGYRFNNTVRVEGGYLSQILQLGRQVNNQNVFQYNNGVVINANFNIDATKKHK
jgi:hypothetical protein